MPAYPVWDRLVMQFAGWPAGWSVGEWTDRGRWIERGPVMPDAPEARLKQLGIELPEQLPVLATYRLATRHRDIVYLAGHVSATLDRSRVIRGKVGAGLNLEEAQDAARICALHSSPRCARRSARSIRWHKS